MLREEGRSAKSGVVVGGATVPATTMVLQLAPAGDRFLTATEADPLNKVGRTPVMGTGDQEGDKGEGKWFCANKVCGAVDAEGSLFIAGGVGMGPHTRSPGTQAGDVEDNLKVECQGHSGNPGSGGFNTLETLLDILARELLGLASVEYL